MRPIIFLVIFILALIAVAALTVGNSFLGNNYSEFTLDENMCEHHFQSCTCFGPLLVRESYPPQFECQGFKYCKDIDETICRNS